jgi:hypothetical protein
MVCLECKLLLDFFCLGFLVRLRILISRVCLECKLLLDFLFRILSTIYDS